MSPWSLQDPQDTTGFVVMDEQMNLVAEAHNDGTIRFHRPLWFLRHPVVLFQFLAAWRHGARRGRRQSD